MLFVSVTVPGEWLPSRNWHRYLTQTNPAEPTITDLCHEDKKKIGMLVNELARYTNLVRCSRAGHSHTITNLSHEIEIGMLVS